MEEKKINVIITDDHKLFRKGIIALLEDFDFIGETNEASNGAELIDLLAKMKALPDVILLDLRMPVMDGVECIKRVSHEFGNVKVIALTTFDEDELVFDSLRAGAVGYLLKDVSPEKLFEAIRSANRGEYYLPPNITAKVMAEFTKISPNYGRESNDIVEDLSRREQEILQMVAIGLTNKEIASKLVIAEGTVKNHLTNIFNKLNARDRMQAVLIGKRLKII